MGTRGRKPGTPKTGGRVKGVKNVRCAERQEVMDEVSDKLKELIPDFFDGDAHTLLMTIYKDTRHPLPIRIDAAKSSIRYEIPALATTEVKQDPEQFAKEQAAKAQSMDITEVARRVAFFLAEARRKKAEAPPAKEKPEMRTH